MAKFALLYKSFNDDLAPVGFRLPVFKNNEGDVVQLISPDAHIMAFSLAEFTDEPENWDTHVTGLIAEVGDPAIFIVALPDGDVIVGNQRRLSNFLYPRADEFRKWPDVYCEILSFIGDNNRLQHASDAFYTHFAGPNDPYWRKKIDKLRINGINYNMHISFDDVFFFNNAFSEIERMRGDKLKAIIYVKSNRGALVVPGAGRARDWEYREVESAIGTMGGTYIEKFYTRYFINDYCGARIVDGCGLASISVDKSPLHNVWRRLSHALEHLHVNMAIF